MSETAFPLVTSWTMQAADGYQACLEACLGWQQEWTVRAATDYAQETARLAQLATSLSLTGTTPDVQESAALVA